jgi:hypothetical protein
MRLLLLGEKEEDLLLQAALSRLDAVLSTPRREGEEEEE